MTAPPGPAVLRLRTLAAGLPLGDVGRLLERVAQSDDSDELRAVLTFLGAAALLGEVQAAPAAGGPAARSVEPEGGLTCHSRPPGRS